MATVTCTSTESAGLGQDDRQAVYSEESKAIPACNGPQGDDRPTLSNNSNQVNSAGSTIINSGKEATVTLPPGKQIAASHVGVELIAKDLRGTVKW